MVGGGVGWAATTTGYLRAAKGEELDVPALEAAFQLVVLAKIRRPLRHGPDIDISRVDAAAGRRLRGARVVDARLLHRSQIGVCRLDAQGGVKIPRSRRSQKAQGKAAVLMDWMLRCPKAVPDTAVEKEEGREAVFIDGVLRSADHWQLRKKKSKTRRNARGCRTEKAREG